jgi:tetratricopeptide (TPR) repeat protein
MRLSSTVVPLILALLIWQSPQDSIRRHYEAAEALRLAGNSAAAETEYTAILTEGYERLGEVYLVQERHQEAIEILESALEYRPNSPALLINLAIANFGLEKYDKAADAARRALVLDSQSSGAHQMLGKSYFMLGELGKSVSELETAAKFTPNDVDVVYTLGIAYLRNRQFTEAKKLYDSMLTQFGERPQLHVVIGRAYRQSGLLTEAVEEFKKAIALDAHFPRAHYYLGITYLLDEGQSKLGAALEEFKLEVAENPDEFLGNYYLGVVYIFQRQWESAITVLEKAVTIDPKNPDPYFQLGQAYQELNQHERAVEVLKKAIVFNPNLAHNKGQVTNAHHRLAQSLLKLGQTEAGRKELQIASDLKAQAFKLEQQIQTDTSGMGLSRLQADEASATELSLRKRLNSAPTEPKSPELASTAAYYEKVVATAHNNVGLLRAEQKDFRAAAAHFSQAIELNPEQEGLTFNLGLAYYKDQSYERAIPPLEQELKLHPQNDAARVLLGLSRSALGQALLKRRDFPGAIENLEAAAKLKPEDADVHYQLGQAYLAAGRQAEGKNEIAISNKLKSKVSGKQPQ